MSTSIHSGIVDFDAALYGTYDDPVDNVVARDGVLNGLLHAGDSMGQVRVNWHPIDSGVANGQASFASPDVPDELSQFTLCAGSPFGQWPLTLRQDGTPYRLIIRVGGAMSSSPSSESGILRVVIAPDLPTAAAHLTASQDNVWGVQVTSATVGWLSGSSQGSAAASNYVTVEQAQAEYWIQSVSTYDAVSSASPIAIEQCLVSAWVFISASDSVDKYPVLHALHIREFIAP